MGTTFVPVEIYSAYNYSRHTEVDLAMTILWMMEAHTDESKENYTRSFVNKGQLIRDATENSFENKGHYTYLVVSSDLSQNKGHPPKKWNNEFCTTFWKIWKMKKREKNL